MADKTEDKSGELILALQNRINDLETKLTGLEKERKENTWVNSASLDSKIAEVKTLLGNYEAKLKVIEEKGNANTGQNTGKNWIDSFLGW